jgi:hypothetical protein
MSDWGPINHAAHPVKRTLKEPGQAGQAGGKKKNFLGYDRSAKPTCHTPKVLHVDRKLE